MSRRPLSAILVTTLAIAAIVGGAIVLESGALTSQAQNPRATADPATPRNPKIEAASAGTWLPSPPAPPPWSARSASDVLANLPKDPNFATAIAALSSGADPDPRAVGHAPVLGAPMYVRGLGPGEASEYLVPVKVGTTTIAVMKISLDTNGFGQLQAVRGWSTTPDFPATSQAAAIARAGTASDPATSAELVWTNIRGVAEELQPFWRLTRASGTVFVLFEDGTLTSASDAGL
jgi:hypothetical protein